MPTPQQILERLAAIGQALAATGHGLALIGLGSVGLERERLDQWSDLDFFAIVEPGSKAQFLNDLSWLAAIQPISYAFQNTVDGYKLLYSDEIFCEFAVFEPAELPNIPFAPGQIIWQAAHVDATIALPQLALPTSNRQQPAWLLGEALTCLYIGLCRYQRGEWLSAQRFIQHFAVDRVLELIGTWPQFGLAAGDVFANERRIEQRLPQLKPLLAAWVQGYQHSPASALAIVEFLAQHTQVDPSMRSLIERLANDALQAE
ncbi:hypothetical protein [Herpetosiphon geysericola]|uniref:Uncharacterized protein n=1 Tax=Herpetosiphon geysericola TaxID=70996 RepID=A0A0P6XLH5_9CHLR|nr:hypothetical protein [Herpetosiphon geysericola]KPL81150.1 hypothetical protein SE18_20840 [Herpetosiphon geysericola]